MIVFRHGDSEVEVPEHRSPAEFDIAAMQRMAADRTLITLAEVGEMCGVTNAITLGRWKRATENYVLRGYRTWPPEQHVLRNKIGDIITSEDEPLLTDLPPEESVLPPPAVIGGRWSGRDRWYKGDIYRWGWRVRRIGFDGQPLVGTDRIAGRDVSRLDFNRKIPRRRRIS